MRTATILVVSFVISVSAAGAAELTIHQLDVGNGDCALIIGPNGRGLLIDCGSAKKFNASDPGRVIGEITTLLAGNDWYLLASHYHADHIGWLDNLIAAIGQPLVAYDRGGTYSSATFDAYLAAVTLPTSVRQTIALGDMYAQGLDLGAGVQITCVVTDGYIIGGGYVAPSDENARSIGVLIEVGVWDYLTAGDLQDSQEIALGLEVGDVEVIKVNHHGSSTSSDSTFLGDTSPEVSVCSTHSHGTYKHPRRDAYGRLNTAGSYIYQTCPGYDGPEAYVQPPEGWGVLLNDAVVVWTDGYVYTVGADAYWADEVVFLDGFEFGGFSGWSVVVE
jgi:beta-lactamase superfamily II metal-dependent hydrolase